MMWDNEIAALGRCVKTFQDNASLANGEGFKVYTKPTLHGADQLLVARLPVQVPQRHGVFLQFRPHLTVVATPETLIIGAIANPPEIWSDLSREASLRIAQRGYRAMFRSESFPS